MKIEIELIKMYKSNLFIKISTEIFILTMDLSSHKKKINKIIINLSYERQQLFLVPSGHVSHLTFSNELKLIRT